MTDKFDDFRDRIEEAAIQAELETGEREETLEEAKTNALVRVARMTLGFVVVIIGIIALPLPGPGWLIIAAGLTILAKDVAWADRLLRYIRKRVPGIPEDGKIPRSSLVTMAVITLAAVAASMWWTFGRGSDAIQAGAYDVVDVVAGDTSQAGSAADRLNFGDDGPFALETADCGTVEFGVAERSKETFQLEGPLGSPDCGGATADLVAAMTNAELTFEYGTEGIVNWFFADNFVEQIIVNPAGDGDAWTIAVDRLDGDA